MNDKYLYLILKIIFNNKSIALLRREKLNFTQIAGLIKHLTEIQFIEAADDKLVLTSLGLDAFHKFDTIYKKTKKEDWIQRDLENIIPQLGANEIFLPSQDDLLYLDLS